MTSSLAAEGRSIHGGVHLPKPAALSAASLMLRRQSERPDPSYERRTDTIMAFLERGLLLMS